MDTTAFTHELAAQGFDAPLRLEREANGAMGWHTHPFEARALVLAGEIRILTEQGPERTYRAGDVFHLRQAEPHAEWYGPQGVTYLSGRKVTA